MKSISFLSILFISILSYAQDKFPENWDMDKFCNVWDESVKKSNEDFSCSICYFKYSDSIIGRDLFLKQEIDFLTDKPEASSIKDLKNACYSLFSDVSFLTYSEKFNLIFERQYSISLSKRTISGMALGMIRHHEGVFYKNYDIRGYWDHSFPKNPCDDWNAQYFFKGDILMGKIKSYGELKDFSYIRCKKTFGNKIGKNIQKYLFCSRVVKEEKLDDAEASCGKLFARYNNPNESDKTVIEKIKDKTDFVKTLSGVWTYNLVSSGKSFKFEFLNKNTTFSVGICNEFLKEETYIYPQKFDSKMLEIVEQKKADYFQPMISLFYDPFSGAIVLMESYDFISETDESLRFNMGGFEYECSSSDENCFSKNEAIFSGYNNYKIKWVISSNRSEIKEYICDSGKWILYSVMKKVAE